MGKCMSMSMKRLDMPKDKTLAECTFSINIKTIYSIQEFCGSGHYGTVNKAVLISDPKQVFAIKKISKELIRNTDHLRREVDILCLLHHPNIIKIYETYQDSHFFYIVMQYCGGGTLYSRLSNNKSMTEQDASILIKQMIEAVLYLQQKGICHRDIKPENFLFSSKKSKSKLVLIDFGLSHKLGKWFRGMHSIVGTVYYIAPEVINGKYDEKCDNWSIGVIMYLLLTGSLPFVGTTEAQIMHKILHTEVSYEPCIWKKISHKGRDLVHKLLNKNPQERISMQDAYQHPWLSIQENENLLLQFHNFEYYAQKEEVVASLMNELINTFNYLEIENFFGVVEGMDKECVDVKEFQEILGIKLDVLYNNCAFNAKKVVKGALWAKLHLNEEKIWKAYSEFDYDKIGKITYKELISLSEVLEGKNRKDFSSLRNDSTYTFDDVMRLYDNGKLVKNYKV